MVGAHVGDVAPALTGTSLQGHQLSLSAWRGSVVVVLFWASWCTPCQREQPGVNSVAHDLAATGVHFVGVSVDVDRSAARSYLSRYTVPYDSLIDQNDTIVVDFEVAGPPSTFVIGRNGRVAAQLVGEVDIPTLRADIATAQAGP
jgi:peroxiredoxin